MISPLAAAVDARGAAMVRHQRAADSPRRPQVSIGEMVEEPAFYQDYMTGPKGRRYGTVAWHDSVLQVINDENIVRLAMQPRYLPMLACSPPDRRPRYPAPSCLHRACIVSAPASARLNGCRCAPPHRLPLTSQVPARPWTKARSPSFPI